MVVWSKPKVEKDEGLPLSVRKNIAAKVLSRMENAGDIKGVSDELASKLADLLSDDFKGGDGVEYAIGVATGQVRRYIAMRVYELITKS
jgi:hypothetical protein